MLNSRAEPAAAPETNGAGHMPTHRDIVARLDEHERRNALADMVLQRVETKLDTLKHEFGDGFKSLSDAIGWERQDERGKPIGTGVVGRLMRLELRTASTAGIIERAAWVAGGALGVLVLVGPVIWWLVANRVAPILQ